MSSAPRLGALAAFGLVWTGAAVGSAFAADEEIQVYMDEIGQLRKLTLDAHVNYVIDGRNAPSYPGEQISEGRTRFTPEFGYALSDAVELGAYLPLTTISRSGDVAISGAKVRVKYVAPRPKEQAWYWGANLEVGRVDHALDPNPWNGELKGIVGGHWGKWTLAGNANLDFKISGPEKSPTSFGLAEKASYALSEKTGVGFESYDGLGPLAHPSGFNRNDHQIFAVVDTSFGAWDLNFGIGRGYGAAEDRWVVKAVIGVPIG